MIFNHCIYGTINRTHGTIKLTYYNFNFEEVLYKEYNLNNNLYQFNLGDSDLKTLNSDIKDGDVLILEYYNSGIKEYSTKCVLDLSNNIQEFNIEVDIFNESTTVADFIVSEQIVKTTNFKMQELNMDLYNYFKITDEDDLLNPIKYEGNLEEFKFVPLDSHRYNILQKSINETSNIITQKEYNFNAIVSSASINRSSKCKGINDSIKILFLYSSDIPTIEIYKDDTKLSSGTMALEGGSLYSYNFVFPSTGYFCFRVKSGDETFLISFRVLQNNFRPYFIEEGYKNKVVNYDMYFINDLNTIVKSGVFTHIDNGLYTTQPMEIDYGDYMFRVNNEEFVVSFEDCGSSCETDKNGLSTNISEEIYWVFPNNIGD